MNEVISFGPFMVQYIVMLLFIGVIAGYIAISIVSKVIGDKERKEYLDIIFTSLMILALVWKFGPILLQPKNLVSNPIATLLLVKGSPISGLIGGILTMSYFTIKLKRRSLNFFRALDYLGVGFLVSLLINNAFIWKYGLRTSLPWGISIENYKFHYHPINVYNLIVLAIIVGWLVFRKLKIGTGRLASTILMVYGIGNMMVSYLTPQQILILGLSVQQLSDLLLLGIGGALHMRTRVGPQNKNNKEDIIS